MNINFKKLVTRDDWESALSDIIELAQKAVAEKDEDELSEATDLLNKFTSSAPATQWAIDLDRHASDALGQLSFDIASATNDDIASRTDELRRIAKSVQVTVAANDQAAADIRHAKLVQALTSAMDAAKAAKDLQAAVKDNAGDSKIADAAQTLLEAISNFKDTVADPGS